MFSRWFGRSLSQGDKSNSFALPPEWSLRLEKQHHASAFREDLKGAYAKSPDFPLATLLEASRQAGWPENEIEKLAAYGDYFAGKPAIAHQRVVERRLAEKDYPLFMTACVQCYVHDRYEEGLALLRQFRPEAADGFDPGEFYAYAGYLAFCGGGSAEDACAYFDAALAAGHVSALLVVNAYPIYFEAGRLEEAALLRRQMAERYADDTEAIYAAACVELARDYYPEGFRLAEARYRMPEAARSINASLLDKPRWQGESLRGRKLLVHAEQGFGDLLMMARYLPLLSALEAQVAVHCQGQAIPLLAANFPDCHFIPGSVRDPVDADFDWWIGIMSLPHLFKTTSTSVPARGGYLHAPTEQTGYWRARCEDMGRKGAPRIGLAWSGNPGHRADRRRSLRFEQVADFVRAWKEVDFFALQTAVPKIRPGNLIDVSEELLTFADTAALIAEMDLVITVDTSAVHLAGALGVETWLLLPYRYEWRWSLDGEGNCWYGSVRVLRQKTHGDWKGVLEEVFGRRLPAWLAERGRETS